MLRRRGTIKYKLSRPCWGGANPENGNLAECVYGKRHCLSFLKNRRNPDKTRTQQIKRWINPLWCLWTDINPFYQQCPILGTLQRWHEWFYCCKFYEKTNSDMFYYFKSDVASKVPFVGNPWVGWPTVELELFNELINSCWPCHRY